jgi:hypothetical protein
MWESYFEEAIAVDTWRWCLRSEPTNEQNTCVGHFFIFLQFLDTNM